MPNNTLAFLYFISLFSHTYFDTKIIFNRHFSIWSGNYRHSCIFISGPHEKYAAMADEILQMAFLIQYIGTKCTFTSSFIFISL